MDVHPSAVKRSFIFGTLVLMVHAMVSVEKSWVMSWSTTTKYKKPENIAAYQVYVGFLMNELVLVEICDKLTIYAAGMAVDVVALEVTHCIKLYSFCANLKRKERVGKWTGADDYNLHFMFTCQDNWLIRLGYRFIM